MKVYKSKLGLELIIPISLLFGIVLYMTIRDEKWIALGIILATISFICHVFLSIKYSIEKENLNIKCGFFINQNIDISTIKQLIAMVDICSSYLL